MLRNPDPLKLTSKEWLQFVLMGVLNNALPFSCFAFAEIRITSGLAALDNTLPVDEQSK